MKASANTARSLGYQAERINKIVAEGRPIMDSKGNAQIVVNVRDLGYMAESMQAVSRIMTTDATRLRLKITVELQDMENYSRSAERTAEFTNLTPSTSGKGSTNGDVLGMADVMAALAKTFVAQLAADAIAKPVLADIEAAFAQAITDAAGDFESAE